VKQQVKLGVRFVLRSWELGAGRGGSLGEEGEDLEREFRAMQKVVDRYYHAEIDGDHLRKPRDLVFRGRARKIEQVEFRHGQASQLSVIS
jgi:hypothetical protein